MRRPGETRIGKRARWGIALVAGLALLLAAAAVGAKLAMKEPVVREALAKTNKVKGTKEKTLGLSKVVVRPGAELPLHHHPGTQIARVVKGTLTYTVVDGKATVKKGDADSGAKVVAKLRSGDTHRIKAGQWIIEQPSDHHMAANKGDEKVVIYLATLFPKGAPPSIAG